MPISTVTTGKVYVNLLIVELNGKEDVTYGDKEVVPVGVDVPLFVSVVSGRGVTGGDRYVWVSDPVAAVISARVADT